jgi:hypothetical protein
VPETAPPGDLAEEEVARAVPSVADPTVEGGGPMGEEGSPPSPCTQGEAAVAAADSRGSALSNQEEAAKGEAEAGVNADALALQADNPATVRHPASVF